jgi:putrescine aminotransferase
MTYGKAFGGGIMPITGIICRPHLWTEELIDNPWLLGSPTFGGNPLACSAALATIKYMLENDVPGQCREKGEYLITGIKKLFEKYPTVIQDVRGIGLMIGLEFVTSDVGYSVAKGMFARRVLTAGTLVNSKCIRFEPAAVITYEDMDNILVRLEEAVIDTKEEFKL